MSRWGDTIQIHVVSVCFQDETDDSEVVITDFGLSMDTDFGDVTNVLVGTMGCDMQQRARRYYNAT